MKILITGTPRSGTQWLVPIVQIAAGWVGEMKEWVKHEPISWKGSREIDTVSDHIENVAKMEHPYVEIGGYSNMTMLQWMVMKGRVVHLVRDPHDTARSIVRAKLNIEGIRHDMENMEFVMTQKKEMFMTYDQALHYWIENHTRILRFPLHGRVLIENLWGNIGNVSRFVNNMFGQPLSEKWSDEQREWMEKAVVTKLDSHAALPYPDVPPREAMPGYVKALARDFGYDY